MRANFFCLSIGALLIPFPLLGQWVHTPLDSLTVNCIARGGSSLFAGTNDGAVYRCTDGGTAWAPRGTLKAPLYSLFATGTNLIAGVRNGVLVPGMNAYVSTDDGISWRACSGMAASDVMSLAGSGAFIFAGTERGVFISPDSGMSWSPASAGMGNQVVMSLATIGTYVIAGTNGPGVYRSTDRGTTWSTANEGLTNNAIWSLAVRGNTLFAGVTGGVFRSTDSAATWVRVSGEETVLRLAAGGPYLVGAFGAMKGRLFLSTDDGTHWIDANGGKDWDVLSVFIDGDRLIASCWAGGIWYASLANFIPTDTVAVNPATPRVYALDQNYPNPFNPGTTIRYELPVASHVILTVYDILGRTVSVLVNERIEAGAHDVKFVGATLASGMYFYRLQAGDYTATKRLLLFK